MIIWTTRPNPLNCLYPLNDDGTLAAALGYGYAGPAVGDGQRMQYTLGAGGGVKILVAGAATTTARFHRGELPIGFEAVVNDYAPTPHGLAFVIMDGAGAVINAVTMLASAVNDVLQMELSASGVLTAKKNGVAFDLSSYWLAPAGQKTVGASDYFAPYLWLTDQAWAVGEVTDIQLVTNAADMAGTYSGGAVDLCGTPL